MTEYKYAQLTMVRTTADFLSANATITATMPQFGIYFSVVTGNLVQIGALNVVLDKSSSSETTDKGLTGDELKDATLDISKPLTAYANNSKNYALLAEVQLVKSDLKLSGEKLMTRCQKIHDLGVQYLAQMTGYDLTATQLEAQQELITEFTGKLSSVRLASGARTKNYSQAEDLLEGCLTAIRSIDLLVNMVNKKNPTFYALYYNARRVKSPSSSVNAAIGSIMDAATKLPLRGVSVKVYAYTPATEKAAAIVGSSPVITRTSGKKGRFNIAELEPGMYKAMASKPGYVNAEITISIATGETTRIDLVMGRVI
jgi:hypothetical protein